MRTTKISRRCYHARMVLMFQQPQSGERITLRRTTLTAQNATFSSHYFNFSRISRKKCARPSRLYTVALKYNATQRISPLILLLHQRYWISQLFKRSSSQRIIPLNQLQLFISPRHRVDTHHQDTLSCNTLAIHLHSSLKHKKQNEKWSKHKQDGSTNVKSISGTIDLTFYFSLSSTAASVRITHNEKRA